MGHDTGAVDVSQLKVSHGLDSAEAARRLEQYGRNELEEKHKSKFRIYLEQLYGPMPIMIWMAVVIEFGIQNWVDAALLLVIQFSNATIGWHETTKAGDAVAALKASLKPKATVKRDGQWQTMDAALLVPGDLVLLGSGSNVPADCFVNDGQIDVDQSAINGESLPATKVAGGKCLMGTTVVRGEVEATVEFTGKDTEFGKTAALIQLVGGIGHLQKLIMTIMIVLLCVSFVLCFASFGYLMGKKVDAKQAVDFTVIVLVASIPIAIEIVVTTTLALGSRQLATHGAIVTRLGAIEEMAGMNILCSDKTGTLTMNKMEVQEYCPTFMAGMDRDTVILLSALAAKWREPPRDALDTMVLGIADLNACDQYKQTNYLPFDPTTKRTEATLVGPDGQEFKVTKGAPHVILKMVHNKGKIEEAFDAIVEDLARRGIRCLAVARTIQDGSWEMAGLLTFLDPPRPDTKETITQALELGVDVKMITGDHMLIAKEMCRMLGMRDNVEGPHDLPNMTEDNKIPKDLAEKYGKKIYETDGFAQVFPQHKSLIVETLRQSGFAVGMTGDGVNDAPALKWADVGIAVAGATDAARAAADIVLTEPGLSTIIHAILIARTIFGRMKSFLTYRIAATFQLLLFFVIAVFAFDPKKYYTCAKFGYTGDACAKHLDTIPDFFSLPVIMLMLITLLNDGTLISIGYDNVIPARRPEKWRLRALFTVSITLAFVALISSLILLYLGLDSPSEGSVFRGLGIGALPYGKVTTMMYLKISISDFLTLFSARTHEDFFWTSRPHPVLLGGGCIALSISTILGTAWPKGKTDGVYTEGLGLGGQQQQLFVGVWLYCLFWWGVQDVAKILCYKIMRKYNIFDVNSSDAINIRGAENPADKKHPLSRASMGHAEHKHLERKANDAMERLERMSNAAPSIARVSQRLQVARTSVRSAKSGGGPVDRQSVQQLARDVHAAAQEAADAEDLKDAKSRAEAQEILAGMQKAIDAAEEANRAAEKYGGAGEAAAKYKESNGDHNV